MEVRKLIEKFLAGNCSREDLRTLEEYLSDPDQKDINEDFYNLWKEKSAIIDYDKSSQIWRKLESVIDSKTVNNNLRTVYKYAAALVLFFGIAYFYTMSKNQDSALDSEITITQGDGTEEKIIVIDSGYVYDESGEVIAHRKNEKIYFFKKANNQEVQFNTIKVPNGKKIEIVLPDSSQVYLNGGTVFKFPMSFGNKESRLVELKGEAYFSVHKDTRKPFIVSTENFSTRVFGTIFNIEAYPNDDHVSVVLLEGSVGVYSEKLQDDLKMITPNHLASYSKNDASIEIRKVSVEDHIAWVNGVLLFRNESFKKIREKLEIHYGVPVKNHNMALEDRKFSGRFENESIEEVLKVIQGLAPFEYEYKNEVITIK
ncbi:FecR family protein [Zhouia amylolytica]|uniref:FecR family protein n=1 Tax=Zhouia amylolytica AD3 TaxID=1286632 RepID=W2UQJ8_9FLAO|nr:FecR family protein [Zhouia amylolytica]ETN96430.1 hypothetical protein P278_06980 [Zhouia amylolytica AD3]